MRPEDVAQYLQDNPQFFEKHADTLTQINLPHPHGGRTISLSERQLLALREKNKELEIRMSEMMAFAQENDALQHKVHEFVIALFALRDLAALQEAVPHLLRDIFAIPHAVMRLWQTESPSAEVRPRHGGAEPSGAGVAASHPLPQSAGYASNVSEVRAFADVQTHPVCLHRAAHDTADWFGERAAQLHSYAYLPLHEVNDAAIKRSPAFSLRGLHEGSETVGLLVLASEEKQRFYPGMGTIYLQRIAEAVSSALHPYLEH